MIPAEASTVMPLLKDDDDARTLRNIKDKRLQQFLLKALKFAWKPKRYGYGGMVLQLFYKLECVDPEFEAELPGSYWWTESEREHYVCEWFPDSFGKELDCVIQEVLYELLPEFIETGHRDGDWIWISVTRLDEEQFTIEPGQHARTKLKSVNP